MIKPIQFVFLTIIWLFSTKAGSAQFVITEVGTLPEPVSNNAVCEGFIDGMPYLFSFSGIDSTRHQSGIHLKSFRYNITTGESERIADLPDEMGKIGVAASRIGDTIYIAGGYNVFSNGSEKTTQKMHRYDVANNVFLEDAAQIPVPTDDHVQAVWRDSLIYLITGWHDTENIPDVQIYNPATDQWSVGTGVPNLNTYKSFGASGTILGDTIYYFGGARSSGNFGIQNNLRMGIINPDQPTEIEWSIEIPDFLVNGYRMAATTVGNELHWIGGSNNTYNFNGIAYDNSGPVSPNKRDLYLTPDHLEWMSHGPIEVPMDLRGIANVSATVKYIAGGMIDNRMVTDKVYKCEWQNLTDVDDMPSTTNFSISPNPVSDRLILHSQSDAPIQKMECYKMDGSLIFEKPIHARTTEIDVGHLRPGNYIVVVHGEDGFFTQKIHKI